MQGTVPQDSGIAVLFEGWRSEDLPAACHPGQLLAPRERALIPVRVVNCERSLSVTDGSYVHLGLRRLQAFAHPQIDVLIVGIDGLRRKDLRYTDYRLGIRRSSNRSAPQGVQLLSRVSFLHGGGPTNTKSAPASPGEVLLKRLALCSGWHCAAADIVQRLVDIAHHVHQPHQSHALRNGSMQPQEPMGGMHLVNG